jgi:uncharacterized membrane protein
MNHAQKHLNSAAAIRLTAALSILSLLSLVIWVWGQRPFSLTSNRAESSVWFSLDHDAVLFAGDCLRAEWQVEGIREVYFNGQGVVGSGTQTVCDMRNAPELRIVNLDGTEDRFALPVRILALHPLTYLLVAGIMSPLMLLDKAGYMTAGRAALVQVLRSPYVTVGAITLLGAALRIYHLDGQGLVFDEAMLYHISDGPVETVLARNAALNSAPPLYALLVTTILPIGSTEIFVRFWSLIAGILAIPMVYQAARDYCSYHGALFATFVAAVSLSGVYYSQYVREYTFAMLLFAGLLVCANRWFKTRARSWGAGLIIIGAFAIFMQYGLIMMIGSIALLLLASVWRERADRSLWSFMLTTFLVWGLCALIVYFVSFRLQMRPGGFAGDSYLASTYWNGDFNDLIPYLMRNTVAIFQASFGSGLYGLMWETTATTVLGLFGLLVLLTVRMRGSRWLLIFPFALTMIAGLLSLYPYSGGRQSAMLQTGVWILCGLAFDHGLSALGPTTLRRVTIFLATAIVIVAAWSNLSGYYQHAGFDNVREAVFLWREQRSDHDGLIVIGYATTIFNYYVSEDEAAANNVIFAPGNSEVALAEIADKLPHASQMWAIVIDGERELRELGEAFGWQVGEAARFNNTTLLSMEVG